MDSNCRADMNLYLPEKLHQHLEFARFGAFGRVMDGRRVDSLLLLQLQGSTSPLVRAAAPHTALLGGLVLVSSPAADEVCTSGR